MRLGSIRPPGGKRERRKPYGMKESDAQRLWGTGVLCDVCLSSAGMGVCGRERGAYVKEKGAVSRSMEGWKKDFAGLYILLLLPLVSQLVRWERVSVSERE